MVVCFKAPCILVYDIMKSGKLWWPSYISSFLGEPFYQYSSLLDCVLPSSCWDHPSYISGCSSSWEVCYFHNDFGHSQVALFRSSEEDLRLFLSVLLSLSSFSMFIFEVHRLTRWVHGSEGFSYNFFQDFWIPKDQHREGKHLEEHSATYFTFHILRHVRTI